MPASTRLNSLNGWRRRATHRRSRAPSGARGGRPRGPPPRERGVRQAAMACPVGAGSSASSEHLAERHHRMERQLLPHIRGNVVQVGAVSLRQDHVTETRCVRGEHLLLQPADRQHATLQRHLTGHPDRVPDGPSREQRGKRSRHRDAGARPILRDRSRRNVHVERCVVERRLVDAEPRRRATARTRARSAPTPSSRHPAARSARARPCPSSESPR